MNTLRSLSYIFLFIALLVIELLIGVFTEFSDLEILPFLILLFYISINKFSNAYILAFFFSGIYYDLFYTSNYFGSTSAKFLSIGIIINFIKNKLNDDLFSEFLVFLLAVAIYKFEFIIYSFSFIQLTIIFLISVINYFLFKLINITLKSDVFKKSI
jgi:cell shape-determining protein MreD